MQEKLNKFILVYVCYVFVVSDLQKPTFYGFLGGFFIDNTYHQY